MHSFQPSRGRIFFEVLCAVGIAASCGGAWMQTGATALLAAAGIATLYALVHFFDLFRREPSVAVKPQRTEFEPEAVVETPVRQSVSALQARIDEQLTAYRVVEEAPAAELTVPHEAQSVEQAAPQPIESKPAKAPRKASSRRASAPKKPKATTEPAPVEEKEVVEFAFRDFRADDEPMAVEEPVQTVVDEPTAHDEMSPIDDFGHDDEPFHSPVAPLFEPEPFVRKHQRSMFGRKAGRA